MALNLDPSSVIGRVLDTVTEGANLNEIVVQLAVAAAAIAIAYYIARATCGRVTLDPRWKFGKGDFERVAFSWLSVALVWIAKHIVSHFQQIDGGPLEVILSLLVAWAVIRVAAYVLGHVIPEGGFQRAVIRVVMWGAWIVVILHLVGLLPDVVSALDAHGVTVGKNKTEITLLDVLKGAAAIFFAVVLALWLSRVTETRLMAADTMEMTTRVVISKVLKVSILLVAIFVALPMAGIDITTLSIFSGAVGVGLGFGLQKIASNYVSGFIVLLDRSLRIGDVITVDGRRGEVKQIASRYTVIKGGDGVESIIPNETLITSSVNHHTYSDPKVSVVVSVVVGYDTDVERAIGLLHEAAKRQGRVIEDPPSAGRIKALTERGIELELTVWIKDPAVGDADVRSDLFKDILKTFGSAGISIPYPRREVTLTATPETGKTTAQSAG